LALQNVDGVLTGRGLMDCLQYYDNCLFISVCLNIKRCDTFSKRMTKGKFRFAIDRGGTFTDIWAQGPSGNITVMKLLSEDPQNYSDAPREGIRRILEQVSYI
jgi:hypothetical protein